MTETIPEDINEARKPKENKYIDDASGAFNEYRIENGLSISFNKRDDGSIDQDSIEIQFNETGPGGDDPLISRGSQENSRTVLHRHELNGIPVDEWYESNIRKSNRKPRYYKYDTEFKFDGEEGVRVLTIWGGWAGFVRDFADRSSQDPVDFFHTIFDWDVSKRVARLAYLAFPAGAQFLNTYLTVVPNTYTVVDFIVLADGRRYARLWDASPYPSRATYVDGNRKSIWKMPYDTEQLINKHMFKFHAQASAGASPFHSPLGFYSRLVRGNETAEKILSDRLKRLLDTFPVVWAVDELMPSYPKETLGFPSDASDGETEPVDDPDGPFDEAAWLLYPDADELPPNKTPPE